jgi:hypothetical protein
MSWVEVARDNLQFSVPAIEDAFQLRKYLTDNRKLLALISDWHKFFNFP